LAIEIAGRNQKTPKGWLKHAETPKMMGTTSLNWWMSCPSVTWMKKKRSPTLIEESSHLVT